YIDDIPSIVVTTYVPQSLASGLEKYNFSEVSLFNTLNKQYGVTIGFAKKEFRAVKVEQKDGELLEVERGSPIQLVKTVTYNLEEEPIEYSISRDRGDLSVYKVVLKYQA